MVYGLENVITFDGSEIVYYVGYNSLEPIQIVFQRFYLYTKKQTVQTWVYIIFDFFTEWIYLTMSWFLPTFLVHLLLHSKRIILQ